MKGWKFVFVCLWDFFFSRQKKQPITCEVECQFTLAGIQSDSSKTECFFTSHDSSITSPPRPISKKFRHVCVHTGSQAAVTVAVVFLDFTEPLCSSQVTCMLFGHISAVVTTQKYCKAFVYLRWLDSGMCKAVRSSFDFKQFGACSVQKHWNDNSHV